LKKFSENFEQKLNEKEVELQVAKDRESDLLKRIQELTITENELRDKFHSSELEFSEKINCATLREKDLTEKINQLSKLLEELKTNHEAEKRELEEKLNLAQDELTIMRNTRNTSINESFHNKSLNTSHSQILQDEIESLRCVLELKQSEISELRKTNCELQRTADDAIASQIKCSALESRVEDLQVQLQAKHEEEK
jgi:signal transduction histidine kinase